MPQPTADSNFLFLKREFPLLANLAQSALSAAFHISKWLVDSYGEQDYHTVFEK